MKLFYCVFLLLVCLVIRGQERISDQEKPNLLAIIRAQQDPTRADLEEHLKTCMKDDHTKPYNISITDFTDTLCASKPIFGGATTVVSCVASLIIPIDERSEYILEEARHHYHNTEELAAKILKALLLKSKELKMLPTKLTQKAIKECLKELFKVELSQTYPYTKEQLQQVANKKLLDANKDYRAAVDNFFKEIGINADSCKSTPYFSNQRHL